MKRMLFVCIVFCCLNQSGFAQGAEYNDVYSPDVINPKFNGGGLDKFYEYINKNFDFSKVTKPGKMITSFSLNELGEIKDIRVIQFVDMESATEIIRVLKTTPKWEPAEKGGRPFSVSIKFPLLFKEKEKLSNSLVKVSNSESTNKQNDVAGDNTIYNSAGIEVKPEFPGGITAFYSFIGKNYKTPDLYGLKGKVLISFVIEKDGSLTDMRIIKDIGYGTGIEAIRVLNLCPKWIPAEQNGQKVRSTFVLPISIGATK